jgi:hypothetical protein
MLISGTSPKGTSPRSSSCPSHPYFLACQFHPEFLSKPNNPHPLFHGFVKAAMQHHGAAAFVPRAKGLVNRDQNASRMWHGLISSLSLLSAALGTYAASQLAMAAMTSLRWDSLSSP